MMLFLLYKNCQNPTDELKPQASVVNDNLIDS